MKMAKQCIECYQEKADEEFHVSKSRCKDCTKKRKRREYHSDLETSRLEERVRYDTPKAAMRRIKRFMSQYTNPGTDTK